jgi:CubicO group peptidase (beta-lactamase class C family)
LISSGLEQRNIPAVSIAVAHKGCVIWEQSFGWSDPEKHIKASPETVYSLASTTKPMTATALMILARAGKVDLDAPVERYIGQGQLTVYEGRAKDVTVRRLLHHTAGLPQHFNYFYADEPEKPRPLEETIRHFGIIVRTPGEEFQYANLGYAIIGQIIARVSGKSLGEFMKKEVFEPLSMTAAVFNPDPNRHTNLAIKYDNKGGIIPFIRCDTPGSGHAYASIRDLIRFGMFHLKDHLRHQRPILDDSTIDRMQTEKDGAGHKGGGNESYGLGWFFRETAPGIRTVWHEGGWTGASAMLKLLPAEDIAVAVLMNVYDTEFVNLVTEETIRAMLPGYGTPQAPTSDRAAATTSPSFDLPPGTYIGEIRTFERAIPLILDKSDGGEPHVHLGDPGSPARRVRSLPAVVPRAPGELLGAFSGPLGDPDAARLPHSVVLDLRLAGDELVGTASAMTLGEKQGGSNQRMHFSLPYRVWLRRTSSRSADPANVPGPPPQPRLFSKQEVVRDFEFLKHVYEVDPLLCPECGGKMRIIAFLTDYAVKDRIINHLRLTFVAERPPSAPGLPGASHGRRGGW